MFPTSPTLASTDAMQLGLRGVLGKEHRTAGRAVASPPEQDVQVVVPTVTPRAASQLPLPAPDIKKLGSDINIIFSVIDWDSRYWTPTQCCPMPKLIWENQPGHHLGQ